MSELCRLAEIGKLSGGFVHDLANHVSVMSLSMGYFEENLRHESERIRRHTKESARARKSMQYFADSIKRHMRGKDIRCYFSPHKKLNDLIFLFKYRGEKVGVSLKIEGDESVKGVRLYGSRIRFNQLFSNLISNAIDSFEETSKEDKVVKITIETKNKMVFIRVSDNGRGMNEVTKKKIFEPFFTTKSFGKGVGLGLSTAKEIAEKDFGGSIFTRSEEEKGSVFTVSIPLPNIVRIR